MIPKHCKRLAEVDFPLSAVNEACVEEDSSETRVDGGHLSLLHSWWARRPLASCRVVLLGLLWRDPCDPHCAAGFRAEARKRLRDVPGCKPGKTDRDLRYALLRFIGDFANWDLGSRRRHGVKKVEHYYLAVDALGQPMRVSEPPPPPYGTERP